MYLASGVGSRRKAAYVRSSCCSMRAHVGREQPVETERDALLLGKLVPLFGERQPGQRGAVDADAQLLAARSSRTTSKYREIRAIGGEGSHRSASRATRSAQAAPAVARAAENTARTARQILAVIRGSFHGCTERRRAPM